MGGIADADIGLRPRLTAWRSGAFALAFIGGVGGTFIYRPGYSPPPFGLFHLALRIGPSFDIGAFAIDALVGPGLLASDGGAIGAVEGVLDLGVRF